MVTRGSGPFDVITPSVEEFEDLMHSLDTGLENRPPQLSGPRLYQRFVYRCGQCHCFCAGTQFRESKCSRTGGVVTEAGAPPETCPLPCL